MESTTPIRRCCSSSTKEKDDGRRPSCTDEDGNLQTSHDDGSGDRDGDGVMELTTDQNEQEAAADITTTTFLDTMSLPPVMEKLLSFLSWEEMKVLMLAHPGLLPGAVRNTTTFSKRVRLDISNYGKVVYGGFFGSHHWRHLSVDPTSFPLQADMELKNVESLNIYLRHCRLFEASSSTPSMVEELKLLLGGAENLRDLGLEARVHDEIPPQRLQELRQYHRHSRCRLLFAIHQLQPLELVDLTEFQWKLRFHASVLTELQHCDLSRIRRFQLKTNLFARDHPIQTCWQFLGNMTELRDFRLRNVSANDCHVIPVVQGDGDIMGHLPSTVEKISLQGFQHLSETCDVLSLSRFGSLKELNLLHSSGAVDDQRLQYLIATFPNLTLICFSDCPDVTDFGICGVAKGEAIETGRSLKELKGLQHLTIRSCANISLRALISAMQFEGLHSFDFYRPGRRTGVALSENMKKFFLHVGRNNPSLSKLLLHPQQLSEDPEAVLDLKRRMKSEREGRNPNVKLLHARHWGETEDICSDHQDDYEHRFGF